MVEGAVIIHRITDSEWYQLLAGNLVILMCCVENKTPTMRDINRYTKKYAADWKDIGIELGLKLSTLNIIEKDYPSQAITCFQSMIDNWIKSTTDNATWKALEIALTNVNRQKLDLDPVDDIYGMAKINSKL